MEALAVRVAALEARIQAVQVDVAKLATKAAVIAGSIPVVVMVVWEVLKKAVVKE